MSVRIAGTLTIDPQVLDGSVTRGYAGRSLLWPHALYRDNVELPANKLFLTACNASDPHQQWEFPTNGGEGGRLEPKPSYWNPIFSPGFLLLEAET